MTMNNQITIGELARRGGVADSTVRYYERKGLLLPSGRTQSNYRIYGPDSVQRLHFIRSAQASGLSLEDIQMLLDFRDGIPAPCAEVQAVIDSRLEQIRRQVRDLQIVQQTLERFGESCAGTGSKEPCPVLDEIEGND